MDPGIVYGLAAAFGWAFADLLSSKSAKSVGPATSLLVSSASGIVFYGLLVLAGPPIFFDSSLLPMLALSAAGIVSGNVFFFKAVDAGDISVVSPITAAFAVPVVLISIAYFHETLSLLQAVSVVCVIAGAMLISFKWSQFSKKLFSSKTVAGAKYAFLSALTFGISYSVLKPLVSALGGPAVYFVFMAAGVPFYYLFWRSRRKAEPALKLHGLPIAVSVAFTLSNLAYAEGMRKGMASIVSPVSSVFPLFVVILAYFLFKERLEPNQYAGVLLVVAGVVGLSI